jgi:hypothetical protein
MVAQQKMKYLNQIIILMLMLILSVTFAAAEDVEGYDENTELSLSGIVIAIRKDMRGPVIVSLKKGARVYDIYTGPAWFWESMQTGIHEYLKIRVIGSKTIGRDGGLRIICRQIKNLATGKVFMLRDEAMKPLWHGGSRHGGPRR